MIFSSFIKAKKKKIHYHINNDSREMQRSVAVFCGTEVDFSNTVFKGANLVTCFGGIDCDLRNAIIEEGNIRKNVDDQLLKAIQNEGKIRKENDITPGEYILNGDEQMAMTIPTFGDEVGDLSIKVSSDFFNFGKIME